MRLYSAVAAVLILPAAALAQEKSDKPILVLNAGGHTARVNKVLFTPDGKELVTISFDKTIRFWDVASGQMLRVCRPPIGVGMVGVLLAAALSPDGKTLAVSGQTPTDHGAYAIYLISMRTGHLERVLKEHSAAIEALAFSSDGRWLASGSYDKTARLWETNTGKCKHTLTGHSSLVFGLVFSPDNRRLMTASLDKTARLWSVAAGESTATLQGHLAEVSCVAWAPDGRTIATGSYDRSIRLWNPDGSFRRSFDKLGERITSIAFTPNSSRLLFTRTGNPPSNGSSLLDVSSGKEVVCFRKHSRTVLHGTLSADGTLAATTGGDDQETYVWKTQDASVLLRLASKGKTVWSVAWVPDSQTIVWGSMRRFISLQEWGPLGRTFSPSELELGPLPDGSFRRAQVRLGSVRLETIDAKTVAVKRGRDSVAALKLPSSYDQVFCFTLFPDDRAVVGSDNSGTLLFDTRNGQRLRRFEGHTGGVYAVAPSPDNRYLLSGGADQTIRVWTLDRDAPLLSLFVAGDEWIAWTPEGYYAASPGGERLMGWHVNNGPEKLGAFYPAVHFRKTLYRPDVIKLLLKEGSVEKALEKADKARGKSGKRTEIDKVLPPKVAITAPEKSGLKLDKAELDVQATASSVGDHPVTALRLLVDGRPYRGQAGVRQIATPKLGKVEASWTVKVEAGRHTLAVQAESAVSKAVSEAVEVLGEGTRGLGRTSETLPDKTDRSTLPRLYVLAVGISSYKGDLKLRYAAKDAEALSKVCREKSKALFREVEVKLITDGKATRREILQGLTWLRKQMTQRDVGIVFFAGHGAKDSDSSFYLLPVDGDREDLLSTAVPGEQVKKTLAAVPGRLMVMLDACHAGAVGGDKRRAATSLTDDLVRDLVTDDYGVVVMCSSMGREYSLESATGEHGYFTQALVEGLSGKAANKEGVVYLHRLDAYVTDRVKELTKGRQHPVTAKPATLRSFPLAKP